MAHIHTEPGQHDHTVSIYIFRTNSTEPQVLLHYHKKIRSYAQFGGHIELHETPWQAVIRELKEESGYNIHSLQLLQPAQRFTSVQDGIVHPHPAAHVTMTYGGDSLDHFHTDTTYAFIATSDPEDLPEEGESNHLRLFTRKEVADSQDIDGITRDTALYIFDTVLTNWEAVSPADYAA